MDGLDKENIGDSRRVEYLEEVTRMQMQAINFLASIKNLQFESDLSQETDTISKKLFSILIHIIQFDGFLLYLINEENNDFELEFCRPAQERKQFDTEVEFLVESGEFAWALKRNEPVIVERKNARGTIVIHSLATPLRIRGMVFGFLNDDDVFCLKEKLKLFSLLVQHAASLIESLHLYQIINKKNEDLKNLVKLQNGKIGDLQSFPTENPFPVVRIKYDLEVVYSNQAGLEFLSRWGYVSGGILPEPLKAKTLEILSGGIDSWFEIENSEQLYNCYLVSVKEKDFANLYCVNITHRKKIENKLLEAKRNAEIANRAKTEFLSKMSHELRTPLNAILGFSQLLEFNSGNNLTSTDLRNVSLINKSGKHLLELVNDILDLSSIERGELEIANEIIDVNKLWRDLEEISRPMAEKYGVKLYFKAVTEELYVSGDYTRLNQVFLNLVTNGIKYNKKGGVLECEILKVDNLKLQFRFRDEGIGIPENKLKSIFEPFSRIKAEARKIEGIGIGLSISKNLVELMNGRLWAKSQSGHGSDFFVELPLLKNPGKKLCPDDDKTMNVDSMDMNEDLKTILYIEDNPSNMEVVRQALALRPGVKMLSAAQGSSGIEIARSNVVDLILLDIHLPDINGIEVFKLLKRNVKTSGIPVIGVSSNAMENDIKMAMEAGFLGYISKPINIQDFLRKIDKFFEDNRNKRFKAP